MGDRSEIQWTDATWNPVTGCSKVSPGCAHCYAETLTQRYAKGWHVPGLPWTPKNALDNVILKPERLDQPLRWSKPRMIFVNSMSDLFHERLTGLKREQAADRIFPPDDPALFAQKEGEPDRPDYIAEVFAVMSLATQHTFQVLTKRPAAMAALLGWEGFWVRVNAERMRRGAEVLRGGMMDWTAGKQTLPNVWLGTSIESRHFNWRADALRNAPAAVRFISAEPLLGPLVPSNVLHEGDGSFPIHGWPDGEGGIAYGDDEGLDLDQIDWLIVGGESGPGFRSIATGWVEDLRDAALETRRDPGGPERYVGTSFFFKQWGGRTPKSGGRELDGQEWNEMPVGEPAQIEEAA
ncbi:MAG: DUF5131 family protein [Solirubrobacterales bacterium]